MDNMTPTGRTLKVIRELDSMLATFAKQEDVETSLSLHNKIPHNLIDRRLTEKITSTLRWITGNLQVPEIISLIDKDDELTHGDVIKNLLQERYFNVRMYN